MIIQNEQEYLERNALSHSGVPGMSWRTHKFGKWQKQAVYAQGMPDPNGDRTIDTKTGLPLKSKPCNYKVDLANSNPYRLDPNDPKNNCVSCSMAYELRRRGYDSKAIQLPETKPTGAKKEYSGYDDDEEGMDLPDVLSKMFPGCKTNWLTKIETDEDEEVAIDKALAGTNEELYKNTVKELLKQGNGARGNFGVLYPTRSRVVIGHSMMYEVRHGKVEILDPQLNERRNPKDLLRYCADACYTRLDNLDFDPEAAKKVTQ